jgi:hypothetical protein
VKLRSVFLRDDCILPSSLDPLRHAFGEHWTHVEGILEPVFDTVIRHAGWHYIWMLGSCSRRGWARTQDAAIDKGLSRALRALSDQANAAELDSVQITRYPWFHVANVTVQRRCIQEHSALETG